MPIGKAEALDGVKIENERLATIEDCPITEQLDEKIAEARRMKIPCYLISEYNRRKLYIRAIIPPDVLERREFYAIFINPEDSDETIANFRNSMLEFLYKLFYEPEGVVTI